MAGIRDPLEWILYSRHVFFNASKHPEEVRDFGSIALDETNLFFLSIYIYLSVYLSFCLSLSIWLTHLFTLTHSLDLSLLTLIHFLIKNDLFSFRSSRPGRPPKRGVPFPPMSPQDAMLHLKSIHNGGDPYKDGPYPKGKKVRGGTESSLVYWAL